jgi:hypothetical protein
MKIRIVDVGETKRMFLAVNTDLFEISVKIGQAMRLGMDLERLQPL